MKVTPLKTAPSPTDFTSKDVLVIFGEVFSKGYVNGLIEEAQKHNMKIVYTSVGRRDKEGNLRQLTAEEVEQQPKPFINASLEAGFDLEPSTTKGISPVDQLTGYKMSQWTEIQLDWEAIEESRKVATDRFQNHLKKYLTDLKQHIEPGAKVVMAHIMAGGVPRTKIVMPVMNRVFKGRGDRFVPSQEFLDSEMGRFCMMNFQDVTANTYKHLIEESKDLREWLQGTGGSMSYLAYGYHGTEVLQGDEFRWQTYTPYFQGWAKMDLEKVSEEANTQGITSCVFNCPEILTNSSSIFQGVEVSLYPLLGALAKTSSSSNESLIQSCLDKLQEGTTVEKIMEFTQEYFQHELTTTHSVYDQWPQHNSKDQMEYMLNSSDTLISWHKDPKDLITFPLSELVFKACGNIMLHESMTPKASVQWIGHDVIADVLG